LLNSGNKSLSSYRQKLNAHKTRGRLGWHKRLQNRLKGRRRRACYIQLELQMHNRWKEIFRCSTGERRSVSCTCNFISVSLADRPGGIKTQIQQTEDIALLLINGTCAPPWWGFFRPILCHWRMSRSKYPLTQAFTDKSICQQ